MAGHSKWHNIKIRKGKQDAIRGKLFTKLSREIIVAAKHGGGDPLANARLRVAIEKAKANSVPSENIKRSIQRGTGEVEGADYEEMLYEGYGPSGVALLVECYSENRNRTIADLRHIFSRNGGNLSEPGSVAWQFKHLGQIIVKADGLNEEEFTLKALEAGAEDIVQEEDVYLIYTPIEELHKVNDKLVETGLQTEEVSLVRIPENKVILNEEDLKKLVKLLEKLDDHDDVKETFFNTEIPEDLLD